VVAESRLVPTARHSSSVPISPLSLAADSGPDPESRTIGWEIGRRIAREAARLPRRQREVFALRYYQDLPLAEIAALVGIGVGSVKVHLHRATRRVRESLEADYGQNLPI
jgi:RNA polymerase sigma-70 factor (ECF subfamily)